MSQVKTKAHRPQNTFKLYRLDVQRNGGPFVPESFHETWDAAFDRGLSIFGIEDGDALPPGNDFVVRGGDPFDPRNFPG